MSLNKNIKNGFVMKNLTNMNAKIAFLINSWNRHFTLDVLKVFFFFFF